MQNTYITLHAEQFKAFKKLPLEGAFQMLNLLKFKEKVEETGNTGAEVYLQYTEALMPFFQKTNAKIIYQGKPLFNLIGPEEGIEWDKLLIVEYAGKEEFIKMITSEGYPGRIRDLALEDSRLIVCTTQ